MAKSPSAKYITKHILVSEPDEEILKQSLAGRSLSPKLVQFLRNLMRTKKWTRKITLPSSHDDVAVALVFTSALRETGLEISSELHVFLSGETIIEEWRIVGEHEETSTLPTEMFTSISIEKVYVEGGMVTVELKVPMSGGEDKTVIKTFDFNSDKPTDRTVPHPALDESEDGAGSA
jgi:hypothetical protein